MVYLAEYFGLPEIANFWEAVVHLNKWHQHRISKLIVKKLLGTVIGKKICILGFAFKANTNDTRESASINICKDLIEEGAILFINDPKVRPSQISIDLDKEENTNLKKIKDQNFLNNYEGEWCFEKNILSAAEGADAIVLLTEWENYTKIDWIDIGRRMRKPSWVFDSRSVISKEKVLEANLNLWRVGDGS